ncbi:unnamed protein product, partial [Brenthis ino]
MYFLLYLTVVTIITPALTQIAIQSGVRPDVRFGQNNDRFDVSNIIKYQQKHLEHNVLDAQSDEFRRRGSKKRKHKLDNNNIFIKNRIRDSEKKTSDENKNEKPENSWLDLLYTRKGSKNIKKKIIKKIEDRVNQLANTIITKIRSMRRFDEFAHHDNMDSVGEADFDENLHKFIEENKQSRRLKNFVDKLHGGKQTRRNMVDPEREILLHYGFPLHMKIEGFLQKP